MISSAENYVNTPATFYLYIVLLINYCTIIIFFPNIKFANTSETLSIPHLLLRSHRLAECLRHAGIGHGNCVAIYSEPRLEYAYAFGATLLLGATLVPISSNCSVGKFSL